MTAVVAKARNIFRSARRGAGVWQRLLATCNGAGMNLDDNNQNVQHPFLAALKMFEVAARSAFDTAAAFWRPWSGKREKQEAAAKQQQSNAPSEQARQPIKGDRNLALHHASEIAGAARRCERRLRGLRCGRGAVPVELNLDRNKA